MSTPITDKEVRETVRNIVDNVIEEAMQGWKAATPPQVRPLTIRARALLIAAFNLEMTYRQVEKEVKRNLKDRGEA